MSRIGKKEIIIPQGVTVTLNGQLVNVKGAKGELSYELRPEIGMTLVEDKINFSIKKETKEANAYWGLSRALVASMIKGVTDGYEKKLELVGVGYRVKSEGNGIVIAIGYSHPVEIKAPLGITLETEDNKYIIVKGADKQAVGQCAAEIRNVRSPEPYKGKGIKYIDEVIRRKAGKAGAKK
jgi:large subunit ribosomal protein L6